MSLTKATYSMVVGAPVNVLDFGADPTGATDSYAAIQNAINSLPNGGEVYFPKGTYLVSNSIFFVTDYINLVGDNAIIKTTSANPPIEIGGVDGTYTLTHHFKISGISFDANNLAPYAIKLRRAYSFLIEDGEAYNATSHGMYVWDKQHFGCEFSRFSFRNNAGAGVKWEGDTSGFHVAFNRCSFNANTGAGCDFEPTTGFGTDVNFIDCTFENDGDGGLVVGKVKTLNILNCYTEVLTTGRKTAIYLKSTVRGCRIEGNYFLISDASGQLYGVEVENASGLSIAGNTFLGVNSSGFAVRLQNAAHGVLQILPNNIEGLAGFFSIESGGTLGKHLICQSGISSFGPVADNLTLKSNNPRLRIEDDSGMVQHRFSWESSAGNFNLLDTTDVGVYAYEGANTEPVHHFKKPVRSPRFASGARPSASDVGAGTQVYDTTLSKPIWSDGTAWRDAAGTTV